MTTDRQIWTMLALYNVLAVVLFTYTIPQILGL